MGVSFACIGLSWSPASKVSPARLSRPAATYQPAGASEAGPELDTRRLVYLQ